MFWGLFKSPTCSFLDFRRTRWICFAIFSSSSETTEELDRSKARLCRRLMSCSRVVSFLLNGQTPPANSHGPARICLQTPSRETKSKTPKRKRLQKIAKACDGSFVGVGRWGAGVFDFAGVGGALEIHQENDPLHRFFSDPLFQQAFGPADAGSAGNMREDDVLIF